MQNFLQQVKVLAPDTLVLTSITDSEETDSAPEAATQEQRQLDNGEQGLDEDESSPQFPLYGLYKGRGTQAAKEVQLAETCCAEIERSTHGQSKSLRWELERKGRITASVLHRVATCRSGADGLVAEIMGYIKAPSVFNLRWGSQMEPKAKEAFIAKESGAHRGFQLHGCGLFVMGKHPYLAASPDAIVSCECCDKAVLEVKCPATLKGQSFSTDTKQLTYMNQSMQLRRDHAYYTQVQSQMAATQLSRAYFVVFTGCELTVEIIYFDEIFWASVREKAELFFFNHIFPELQTTSILKRFKQATKTCICQGA